MSRIPSLGSSSLSLTFSAALVALAFALVAPRAALAQPEAPPSEPAPPAPAPYSIPWQLRPAAIVDVVRSDTAFAFYENPVSGESGTTVASMLLGSFGLSDAFAPLVRVGAVSNSPPDGSMAPAGAALDSGVNFLNPVLGATYLVKLSPDLRLALFLGVAVPLGGGGGDHPDPANAQANARGILARSAMDNAMFAADYLTIFPGLGLAYVKSGLTVQLEATVLELIRVRGGDNPANDDARTNFTGGLHVGYFLVPQLSVGAELRHQRWLSTPTPIKAGVMTRTENDEDTLRDTSTMAVGLRGHFELGARIWLRPGVAYARGIDDPMGEQNYHIVQLDIAVMF